MSTSSATTLITGAVTDFGTAVLTIVTATLVVGLGYLVYRFGWKKTKGALR